MISTANRLDAAVDQTLQYFGFFRHPLSGPEVWRYSNTKASAAEVCAYLDELVLTGRLHEAAGYYALEAGVAGLLERRKAGKLAAAGAVRRAAAVGRFIHAFPFVRFVGISGSLSKGYADKSSDFYFFIVTAPDRLWIARSLLHVVKKLSFLVGQQHKLCMNYFIDESRLQLEDRNVYVATELCTLIPVAGGSLFRRFMQENDWWTGFLPNVGQELPAVADRQPGLLKRLSEGLLNCCRPARLNAALMRFTDRRWRRKWTRRGYPEADYDQAFRTRIDISKNHQMNYQKRVLAALQACRTD